MLRSITEMVRVSI